MLAQPRACQEQHPFAVWFNDLENDAQRVLRINKDSRFFSGLQELEMESRIRPLLQRYADFDSKIDYSSWTVNFTREVLIDGVLQTVEHIKVLRGEENMFVWCFFLAVAQLAIDEQEAYMPHRVRPASA